MVLESKKNSVEKLKQDYNDSDTVMVVHYHGLTVNDLNDLRSSLYQDDLRLKIVKNSLAKIASEGTKVSTIKNLFFGPVAIIYGNSSIAAAKILTQFAKKHEDLKILGGLVDSELANPSVIDQMSKLPSLDEIRGKMVSLLQAPASQVLRILSAPAAQVARVVDAYSKK